MNTTLSRAEIEAIELVRWSPERTDLLRRDYPDPVVDQRQLLKALNALPGLAISMNQMNYRVSQLFLSRRPVGEGGSPWFDTMGPTIAPVPPRDVALSQPGLDGFVAHSVGRLREWCHANLILGYDGSPGHTARLNVWRLAMGEPPVRVTP